MMLKLLLTLFIALLIQACQVQEEVTSANQTAPSNFAGAQFTTGLPTGGWKKLADNLDISLNFPLPINVTGVPYIKARVGSAVRRFYYVSGNDTKFLTFRYTVNASDYDEDGIAFYNQIELNGGSLTFSPKTAITEHAPINLNFPSYMTYPEKMLIDSNDSRCTATTPDPLCSVKEQPYPYSLVKVDGIAPSLTLVTAPVAGNYSTNQLLKYELSFSETVLVSGTPSFTVGLISGTVPVSYHSGSGSNKLEFARLLEASDTANAGLISGNSLNLNSSAGITISDQAGNSIPSSIFTTISPNILINVIQPTILSVIPSAVPATYTLGQNLNFTVSMTEAVKVTGTPSIPIQLSTGTVLATYLSGTGTTSLTFRYTVQTNHVDDDGMTLVSPLILNGGSIKNMLETQNASLIYTVQSTPGLLVDAATGPYVVSTVAAANGMYLENQNIDFTLNFNRAVTYVPGTGVARVPIIMGGSTVYADYLSGSNTSALTFRYTPTAGQEDLDGISLSGPIQLTGTATIQDTGLKSAILNYLPPSTTGILVDGTTPSILSVTSTSTGKLKKDQYLYLKAQFSEAVTISGAAPTLGITVGVTPRTALYYSGNSSSTYIFRYKILAGDSDTNGVTITSLTGTFLDPRSHIASVVFAPQTTTGVTIDGQASTIFSFTPGADATYKLGDTIDFVIVWSENIYISGNPKLQLTVGLTTQYATYVPSPTNPTTSSVFRYTVTTGHSAPLGISTSGLILNGGLIRDDSGNDADLSYFYPSLAGIIVDGVIPYVDLIAPPAPKTYKAGESLNFTLTFSEDVVMPIDAVIDLIIGITPVKATYFSATTQKIYHFRYPIQNDQLDLNGITMLSALATTSGGVVRDLAGNNSSLQLNLPSSAMNLNSVKVDAILPKISAVLPPPDDVYKLMQEIDFHVIWSEEVIIDTTGGTPSIALRIDSEWPTIIYATYQPPPISTPTDSVFRYTVASLDLDTDGININGSTVELNGATIKDAATNNATLTFIAPPLSGVKIDGVKATINPANPVTAPASKTYITGENLDFTVNWTENVWVNTTGGTPYIKFRIGSTYYNAQYVAGDGSPNLVFRHTVAAGQIDTDGVQVYSPVYLNGGTIRDIGPNDAYLTYSVHFGFGVYLSYKFFPSIKVDGVAPTITSSTSNNITETTKNNYFKSSQTIEYNLTFSEAVTVDTTGGIPRLALTIGAETRYATYFSATSNATSKRFRLILDSSDVLLDLDGINVSSSIDLNGGTMKDAAGNTADVAFSFSEKDYVYFTNILARYHLDGSNYSATTASCPAGDVCATGVTDIAGNGHNLTPNGLGPKVLSGYGTNSTKYMQFNNTASMKFPNTISIKYAIFVMKNVSNASVTAATSIHTLLNRRNYTGTGYHYSYSGPFGAHTHNDSTIYYGSNHPYNNYQWMSLIQFTSNSSSKSINMYPTQKIKIDGANLTPAYTSLESGPSLWTPDTNNIYIHEFSTPVTCWPGTTIGGSSFNGQVAEAMFFTGSANYTETQLNLIRDQLNAIHGAY